MRVFALCAAVAPFLWLAFRDNLFHFRGRRVPLVENLLHLGLGAALVVTIGGGIAGNVDRLLGGVGGVAVLGALDEFVYHRQIPVEEHDLHAKEHFTLMLFVAAAFAFAWYGR